MFRIITLKTIKIFLVRYSPDPPIFKKVQSDSVLIRAHLCHFPVSSEISDFTSCTHAQTDILDRKHADKTDY